MRSWAERPANTGEEGGLTLLEIYGQHLRNPHIARTANNTALFVPPGWRHIVYTLEGGHLAGYPFPSFMPH